MLDARTDCQPTDDRKVDVQRVEVCQRLHQRIFQANHCVMANVRCRLAWELRYVAAAF